MELDIAPNQSARISATDGSGGQASADIVSFSRHRLTVRSDFSTSAGVAVKLEWSKDVLLLGEILSVQPDGLLIVQVRHLLKAKDVDYIRKRWV